MFKRARWMAVGYTLGAGTAYYAGRRLKQAASRLAPNEVVTRVGSSVTGSARQVQTAVSAGRAAMRDREAELRHQARLDADRRRLRAH